jgi:hypothetical protein
MLEVSRCIEPLGGWPAVDDGGRRVAEDTRRPPGRAWIASTGARAGHDRLAQIASELVPATLRSAAHLGVPLLEEVRLGPNDICT